MPRSRRALLKLGGIALTAVPTAGCSTADDRETTVDGRTSTATSTASPTATPTDPSTATPASDPTDARSWLPAPAAVGTDHYTATSASIQPIQELSSKLGEGAARTFTGAYRVPGIDEWAQVRTVHEVAGLGTVTIATFDRATVEDALRSALFDPTERTYRGYTVFEGRGAVAAVGDGAVVTTGLLTGPADDGPRTVDAFVDAAAGTGRRYVEASTDFDLLVRAIGPSQVFRARTHDGGGLPGAVADGIAYYLGSRTSRVELLVVFEPGSADEGVLAEWARGASVFRGREPTTEVSGRVVTAGATLPTADIAAFTGRFPGTGPRSGPVPQASFAFEYEETGDDRGLLTITHDGGDAIPSEELFVRGIGFADVAGADQTSAGPWGGTTSDGAVAAGDAVVVGVASDYEIRLVWQSADGNGSAALVEDEGPDT